MKLRWLRPFIVLSAAAIVSISSIIMKRPILSSLIWLLGAIIVFYIVGSIVTRVIDWAMNDVPKNQNETEDINLDELSESNSEESTEK